MLREQTVYRLAFVAVLASLPVQYYIKHRLAEPYPSLFMPGFEGANTKNGKIQQLTSDLQVQFCTGKEITLTPEQFFPDLPVSHVKSVMDWMFSPRRPNPHPLPRWKVWFIRDVSPGYGRQVLRAQGLSPIDAPTRQWLYNRIIQKYDVAPATIRVLWYMDAYDLSRAPLTRSRRLISTIPVELASCAR